MRIGFVLLLEQYFGVIEFAKLQVFGGGNESGIARDNESVMRTSWDGSPGSRRFRIFTPNQISFC
jgi:hypothetical protein